MKQSKEMSKQEARVYLKWLARYSIPTAHHPNTLKRLYEVAELPIPEFLKPVDYTEEENSMVQIMIGRIESRLFNTEE
jgi:hypothetical protein